MSMGGNATKYDLKSSPRSPGMKNAGVHRSGHCIQIRCFIAKETCNLLKQLEIGMCISLKEAPEVNECGVIKSKNVICPCQRSVKPKAKNSLSKQLKTRSHCSGFDDGNIPE